MTCCAQRGDVEISRLHNVAICKEISERLSRRYETGPSWNAPAFDHAHETDAR
jgi:hypothetical protein